MANSDASPDTFNHANLATWGMAIERWWLEPWETSKATMGLLTLVACISPPGIKYTFCCDPLPLSKVSRF
jgi:hypothetical protein